MKAIVFLVTRCFVPQHDHSKIGDCFVPRNDGESILVEIYYFCRHASTIVLFHKIKTMRMFINKLPFEEIEKQSHIFSMLPAALSNVPFHNNTDSITRYFAENFPVHMAVHEVSPVKEIPQQYTLPHVHADFDEINLIISQQTLVYNIQIGNDEYTVGNNSSIWIPKGKVHAANVVKGSGYFITIRLK